MTHETPATDRRQIHDMGGLPAGHVVADDRALAEWEKQVEAMVFLLTGAKSKTFRVDELRLGIESLPAEIYDTAGYYGRWVLSLTRILIEKGIVSEADLKSRVAARPTNHPSGTFGRTAGLVG